MYILSQITVVVSLFILTLVLFNDRTDYISYAVFLVIVSTLISAIEISEARELENYILAIDWEVVFFLISMFVIVEILNEAHVFHEIARRIVKRYEKKIQKLFWVICIISTLSASIIEDLSVAIIFIPIIIIACKKLTINPSPFLFGITICINIASTLTPFGSAENIMIANYFSLDLSFFLLNLGLFFVIATITTLVLLDQFYLKKKIQKVWKIEKESENKIEIDEYTITPSDFKRNVIGFIIFIGLLLFIRESYLAAILGMLLFIFINPKTDSDGRRRPKLSHYLLKVDFKLIFFFICLFILVFLMEINGLIREIEQLIETISTDNVFLVSIMILIITSLLSGLIDNVPVTIIFLPILNILISHGNFPLNPIVIAFILGINLGGNFLPQGSAADMMTLELAQKNNVEDVTYKSLTKIGGLFAGLHVLIGMGYLAVLIYIFPTF